MPSFDIVSEVDGQEVINAVDQAKKEIATRFDFRDAKAEIELGKEEIKLSAVNEYKLKALEDVMIGKLAKRNVSLKNIDRKKPDISPLGYAKQELKIIQGLDHAAAKQVVATVKDAGFKVQCQIQDKQIRVTGKSRDELQAVIALLRGKEFPVTLNYTNFRA